MNYERIYNQIIEKAISENRQYNKGIYYEGHHIIPKCMGGEGQPKDINHPNIVLLTAKEHYIAHRLLCLIYPTNNKLFYALWMMSNHNGSRTNKRYIPSSRIYEKLRLQFHDIKMSEEHRMKIIKARKGKTYKEIYGERAETEILKRSNKHASKETKKKISEKAKGRKSIRKGKTYKEIYGDEWMNEIQKRKYIHSEETKKKMSIIKKGKKTNKPPGNSIPININGIIFGSIAEACRTLNITRRTSERITSQAI